jgi:hypothetical protein
MTAFDHRLIEIGDTALAIASMDLAERSEFDAEDFPPSALLACLIEHARYAGWDFEAAMRVARTHGAASAHEIAGVYAVRNDANRLH